MDLQDLSLAFAPITQFGTRSDSVTINNTTFWFRTLEPAEELALLKEFEGVVDNGVSYNEIFYTFKLLSLSYAITKIGDLDLAKVDYVETGETTSSGAKVKIRRQEAIRKVLQKWGDPLIHPVFVRYVNLTHSLDDDIQKVIHTDPVDIDAEIARLTERIEKLKKDKEMVTSGADRTLMDRVATNKTPQRPVQPQPESPPDPEVTILPGPDVERTISDLPPESPPVVKEAPVPQPEAPAPRVSPVPTSVAPPTPVPAKPVGRPLTPLVPVVQPKAPPQGLATSADLDAPGSFFDPSAPEEAIAEHEARVRAMREQAAEQARLREAAAVAGGAVPPHALARQAASGVPVPREQLPVIQPRPAPNPQPPPLTGVNPKFQPPQR